MPRSEGRGGARPSVPIAGVPHEAGLSASPSRDGPGLSRRRFHPVLLPLFLALFSASACSFNYEGANAPGSEGLPDAVFHNFDHNVYMGSTKILSLHAGLAESYDRDGSMVLHDVDFSSYSRGSGALAAEGHAESAVFHSGTQDAEFSGSITIRSTQEDASLEAEYLEWKGSDKTLSGGIDRSVTVTRGDGSWLRGAGFVADSRRRSFSFRESVEGVLVAPETGRAEEGAAAAPPVPTEGDGR